MKTISRSIRRWFGNNRQDSLSQLRQPKKSRKKAAASLRPMFEQLEDRTLMTITPVQTYFVPMPETNIRSSFVTLYSGTSQQINSVISLATTVSPLAINRARRSVAAGAPRR